MKVKPARHQLKLKHEIVRLLTDDELKRIRGGDATGDRPVNTGTKTELD